MAPAIGAFSDSGNGNTMEARAVVINKSSYRDRRINLRSCGRDFFPPDAFGGPNGRRKTGPLVVHVAGPERTLRTEFPTTRSGAPRWFLRDRTWVREFIEYHRLEPGDSVNILRIDEREYRMEAVPKELTFIDLFAGIGGTRLGFEGAGCRCVFSSEWDKHAQRTYEANFGERPAGDITKISADDIPEHDILVAGFPCQPFSIAGVSKKNALGRAHGFADETQGTLFFDIVRILLAKRPRAFVLENVRNLRNHDKGRTYEVIIRNLRGLGYRIVDKVIDAATVVPQHRERIFIVGTDPGLEFAFPGPRQLERYRIAYKVGEILDELVPRKYTLTEHLWEYLQAYKKKHRLAGNGFGFGLVGPDDITRTLSARYYKDGSEILLKQARRNPRRLTPRECARLMGFPDTFRIPVSDTQAYKQFGNAVVVPVLRAIADSLCDSIRNNRLCRNWTGNVSLITEAVPSE